MDSRDETVIKLSKKKLMLLLLGASAFVAAGIWMLSLDDATIQSRRSLNDPVFVHGLGLASIVFFGICGLYALKKLFDKKPGLIFNSYGIVNNASSVSAGFIPWSEILGATIFEVQKQKLLIIHVRYPQEYIAHSNPLKQALNRANYKMVGSPISISPVGLEITFSELVALFDGYLRKYGVEPDSADMLPSPDGEDVHSPEIPERHVGYDSYSTEPDIGTATGLMNWWPVAVRGTVGSGGIGIFVLSTASLDMLFNIQVSFWPAIIGSLLPMLIFFLAVPDILPPRVVRPAQWLAAVWYLVCGALSLSLTAMLMVDRGLEGIYIFLAGFVMLGAWPCLVALRKLRVVQETDSDDAPPMGDRNVEMSSRTEQG
jgi:hypothetical protein